MEKPLQKEPLTAIAKFENTLGLYDKSISDLLAVHGVDKNSFIVTLVNAAKKTPKLLECDQRSIFGAILTSAELGLPPNTPMQLSFLIPYERSVKGEKGEWTKVKECQFQLGYQGWLELMHRNEAVEKIYCDVVYEGDKFVDKRGMNRVLEHEPCIDQANKGKRIAVYAIVWLKGSQHPVDAVLYEADIVKFKKISQSGSKDASPWNNDDKDPMGWMWRKTAIKQVAKMIPKTHSQLSIAIKKDDVVETGGVLVVTEEGEVELVESELTEEQKAEMKKEMDQQEKETFEKKLFKNK
jgi:recombination protein RecT